MYQTIVHENDHKGEGGAAAFISLNGTAPINASQKLEKIGYLTNL